MRRILLLPCFLLFGGVCVACAGTPPSSAMPEMPSVTLRGHRIALEVAADNAARAHGLMDRTSMPADHGMVFVFPDTQIRTFWMKDTLIPLDMLFFDGNRKLITLLRNVPPCKADPCAIYPSTAPARYVLELNGGEAGQLGIREGDIATFVNVPPATE